MNLARLGQAKDELFEKLHVGSEYSDGLTNMSQMNRSRVGLNRPFT